MNPPTLNFKARLFFGRILRLQQRTGRGDCFGSVAAFVGDAAAFQQDSVLQNRLLFQGHYRYTLGILGGLGQKLGCGENSRTAIGGIHRHLHILGKAQNLRDFAVLVSEDGVNYTEVGKYDGYEWGDGVSSLEVTFDTAKVRYVLIRTDTKRPMGIGEIEVYG